jgi:uncharacterized protein YecT (DUF1311 family)
MYKRLNRILVVGAVVLLSIVMTPLLTTSSPVMAQRPRIDCSKATSNTEIKFCSQESYAAADKQLNQAYQIVLKGVQGEQRQLLITGQQNWIRFRDNNCNFEVFASRGGTGYEIFRNGCLERLTKQRTKDLQNYLKNR